MQWKRYSWVDLDPYDLPWSPQTEHMVFEDSALWLKPLDDPRTMDEARLFGFDPAHTYYTVLRRDWNGHARGARVLLEATWIVIEEKTPPRQRHHLDGFGEE